MHWAKPLHSVLTCWQRTLRNKSQWNCIWIPKVSIKWNVIGTSSAKFRVNLHVQCKKMTHIILLRPPRSVKNVISVMRYRKADTNHSDSDSQPSGLNLHHYNDVIMSSMASQVTSLMIVYWTVCWGPDQRKHQSSASLAYVWGIHRRPVNSPHKWPVTRKGFPLDDVIMSHDNATNRHGQREARKNYNFPLHNLCHIQLIRS